MRHLVRHRFLLLLAACSLVLVACGEDETRRSIDQEEADSSLRENTEAHLLGAANASVFLKDSSVACDSVTAVAEVDDTGTSTDPTTEPAAAIDCSTDLDMRPPAQDLVDFLMGEIFVETAIEASTDTSITYRVQPSAVCGSSTTSSTDPNAEPETALDPDCVDMLDTMPVRLVVTSATKGDIDVAVRLGDSKKSVATIEVYRNHLAIVTDLGQALDAYVELVRTEEPDFSFPGEIDGKIRLELAKNAPQDYSLTWSIIEPLSISMQDAGDMGEPFELTLATSDPALSVRIDGAAQQLAVSSDLGALDASMPAAWLGGTTVSCGGTNPDDVTCTETTSGPEQGTIAVHLDGASGAALLSAASDVIELTGLSLGDETSTVTYDGAPLLSLDLNAAYDRVLDATLSADDGGMRIDVSPAFSLSVAMAFENIADQLDDVDPWMLAETLELTLDGAETPAVRFTESADGQDLLEVVAGTLSLVSSEGTIEVGAGECLVDTSTDTTTETSTHPFADVQSGACAP